MGVVVKFVRRAANDEPRMEVQPPHPLRRRSVAIAKTVGRLVFACLAGAVAGIGWALRWPTLATAVAGVVFAPSSATTWYLTSAAAFAWLAPIAMLALADKLGRVSHAPGSSTSPDLDPVPARAACPAHVRRS